MFESIEEEMKKDEGLEPLRKRIAGWVVVTAVTLVVLGAMYAAIVYSG